MSKKHFIELADVMVKTKPQTKGFISEGMKAAQADRYAQWEHMRDALADFCQLQNSAFNRDRWLSYIAGECGPNGGKVKVA
jgi:hypothetical protein